MISIRILLIACAALFTTLTMLKDTIGDIAYKKLDAVVLIYNDNSSDQLGQSTGLGSGFFIGENLIITNTHVVDNSNRLSVKGHESEILFDATVIAKNYTVDIALIKINKWAAFTAANDFEVLEFASSRDQRIGDTVWSIGHPWGLYWTVSQGIVSSPERKIDDGMMYYIQTDAATHQGNSGGPLLNENGKVVGIVSKVFSPSMNDGFGLAIPSDIVTDAVRYLENQQTVMWSAIGLNLNLTQDGKYVMVTEVLGWDSMKGVDIRRGDYLIEITTDETGILGTDINGIDDFVKELVVVEPGEKVILTLLRGGKIVYTPVITESVPVL